jgi:hypothetical protein
MKTVQAYARTSHCMKTVQAYARTSCRWKAT